MARIRIASVGLTISTDTKPADKAQAVLDSFKEVVPALMSKFSNLAYTAAREIAPKGKEAYYDSKYPNTPKSVRNPNIPRLKKSIKLANRGEGDYALTVNGGGVLGTKAYMQEYGYPYSTHFGPYKPNPKNHNEYSGTPAESIRRVGYLRAGFILASEALITNKLNYSKSPRPDDIRNYQEVVTKNLNKVLKKLLLQYAKGNGIPGHLGVSIPVPVGAVSKFAPKFGSIKGLRVNIPIEIEVDPVTLSSLQIQRGYNFLK